MARKPPSSFLSATQQLQASQELEVERKLFPKIFTPGEAQQSQAEAAQGDSSDSEGSSSGSDSDSGSDSGSESDSESDSLDSEDENEEVPAAASAAPGKSLEVRPVPLGKDAAADTLLKINGISSALKRIKASAASPEPVVAAAVEPAQNGAAATPVAKVAPKPKTARKTPAKAPAKTPVVNGAIVVEPAVVADAAIADVPVVATTATTPATGGKGGRGGGRGAGKAGRGANGDTPGAAAGRGGRGGRGASKRRDIDPSLLRNMIAGTSTVSTSSMDAGTSSNAVPTTPAATNGAKKRKAASEGKIGSPQFGPTGTQVKAKKPKVVAPIVAAPAV